MKRFFTLLAVLGAFGLVAGFALAEGGDTPDKKPAKTKRARKPREPRKPTLRGAHVQMAKVCALSQEQVKKILEISAARAKAMKEWDKANGQKFKDAAAEYKKAREAKDKEASKTAREALSVLRSERGAIAAKSRTEVLAVLDDDQKAKWRTYNNIRSVKNRFRSIEFTDAQSTKIEAICAAAADELNVDDRRKRYTAIAKVAAQVGKEVLTDEQRTQFALLMIKGVYRRAKLTEEQLAQVNAAYEKHFAGVDLTDSKAKNAAFGKVHREIRTTILTDDQKKAVGYRERKPASRPAKKAKKAPATQPTSQTADPAV